MELLNIENDLTELYNYEIKENFAEVFESINILENESKDFISVLADIFISMRQKYELESSEINTNINSIAKNFKNLNTNKNNSESEEEKRSNFSSAIESIKNEVAFYFKCFQDKSQDIEIFLKDLFTTLEIPLKTLCAKILRTSCFYP